MDAILKIMKKINIEDIKIGDMVCQSRLIELHNIKVGRVVHINIDKDIIVLSPWIQHTQYGKSEVVPVKIKSSYGWDTVIKMTPSNFFKLSEEEVMEHVLLETI